MKITDEMIEKIFIKSVEKTHDVDFDGTYLNYKDYWKKEYALFKASISLLLPIIEKQAEVIEFYANPMTYYADDYEGGCFFLVIPEDQEDLEIVIPEFGDKEPDYYDDVGGKLARQTQKEIIEMLSKITEETKQARRQDKLSGA